MFFLIILLSCGFVLAQDPDIALVDGKIVFRVGYNPTQFEVNLATSGIKFDNFTDYMRCKDEKEHLDEKLDDLKPSKTKKLKRSLDYLRSENSKR